MTVRRHSFAPRWILPALVAAAMAGAACPAADECDVGGEGCPCTNDGTCLEGLACRSDVCVDLTGGEESSGESTGAPPVVECMVEEPLCDAFNAWCTWGVAHDYFEGESADQTVEECIATYDQLCVDFSTSDICVSDAYCWVNCVDAHGSNVDDVSECICANGCTNRPGCG
jgi:hypothetical protein